ncbi:MAG TPA: serine hydrolase domain-containing protein [Candidatus Acidoferrales bacterium]|jgi:CubicO group peptidase (beta-lactamase class C family)|nr:serine hydrolase domain-containing protein [Candidatus Acidoferrales bacterium]
MKISLRSPYIAAVLACFALSGLTIPVPARAALSAEAVQSITRAFMAKHHFKAIIVQVRSNGANVYTGAFGDSMTGVPATPDMHFRNGALAFTYMSTLLLEFVDQKKTTLDTKLSTYFPNLPHASGITLRELAQMTSGYADYVYQPETLEGVVLDPFRQWTPAELIRIGTSKPMEFAPGTNWGYSHTNYVILGGVLAKIAGMPLADAIAHMVLEPMGLTQTVASTTPAIPEPALHAFTSERREALGVKPGAPFYEEATYWNPSWTTVEGAVETSTITDLSLSLEAVGTGKLLSAGASRAQVVPSVLGLGHKQSGCNACFAQTKAFNYGLGVILSGPWIDQTLGFAGASGAVGYLPEQKLTIAVEATNGPGAYDAKGNSSLGAVALFRELADALAPGTLPKSRLP